MPNTLVHIGVQGFVNRRLCPSFDLEWILLGCVLPDLPWIFKRVLTALPLAIDAYDLRLYAMVQASFAGCLWLALALACATAAPRRIFLLLSGNAAFHLLLDASQTKLGSGVHLLAPFSWETTDFGLYWPESLTTLGLTLSGVAWLISNSRNSSRLSIGFSSFRGKGISRWMLAAVLLTTYLAAPVFLIAGPESTDSHSIRTLREVPDRPGKVMEFDRTLFVKSELNGYMQTMTHERIEVVAGAPAATGRISTRGIFVDETTLELLFYHSHPPLLRDLASYVGLFAILCIWLRKAVALSRQKTRKCYEELEG